MKKEYKVFLIILSLFLFVGCSNNIESKEKEEDVEELVNCELENNSQDNFSVKSNYKIYSENGFVEKVITVETVESDDESILSTIEKQVDETYNTASKKYGGYIYDIEIKNNKLISNVEINYKEMDLNEYIKDNPVMKSFTKNDKITLTGIISIYESLGAKCDQ